MWKTTTDWELRQIWSFSQCFNTLKVLQDIMNFEIKVLPYSTEKKPEIVPNKVSKDVFLRRNYYS